ncbi:UDP-N-acetylglucosamine 1-carboxyvinyltransferase [Porcipelethomonas sp.]|uniref:UDP-N-acetylglucosamine 1-carboxyvinyltransferase n=1 Tax=Porcipelethomonas sp. TaxID=2981675 RepID=UPI003EF3AC4E
MQNQKLVIEGGHKLSGEVRVQGAKNSSLPIIAASLMCQGETVLKNCPALSDTYASCRILTHLGCECRFSGNTLTVKPDGLNSYEIPDDLMHEMRSSIIYMGALLGACGKCCLSFPGGCELGPRPIDMHLSAMKKMGASVKDEFGIIECMADKGLHGTKITLRYPSVGTTENIILAAVKAKGETIIVNAAREPEIVDLALFLNKCGGKIKGAGNSTVVIEGVEKLHGCMHYIMPDRIAAATYISAAASTNGEINIIGIDSNLCDSFISVFEQMGCNVYIYDGCIYVNAKKTLKSVNKIITMPHPGFPTDAQAIVMAVLCKAEGNSIFEENIFENRYRHVDALVKMGADIKVIGKVAVINGVKKLYGAKVSATDLRGGAAMAVAGLGAEGTTEISDISHIDRGYENFESVIASMGGKIKRI